MSTSPRIAERLATADPGTLRRPGPDGDAARRSVLAGSRFAVIQPGYEGKRFIYERANTYGVELVLVGEPDSWARALVDEGVASRYVEIEWHADADAAADAVLSALAAASVEVDGVFTVWEDAAPVAARVAAALGVPGSPSAAADTARSKERTLSASRDAGLPTPRFVPLDGPESLAAAAEYVGFPAVIKPVFGAEAMGVMRVNNMTQLQAGFARVSALVNPDLDVIFSQGSDLMLEEYLDGTEFDVDIVLAEGRAAFVGMSENWPTHEPYFVETGLHSPPIYAPDRLRDLSDHCVATALALGFRDAILHVEAKDTSRGPRLLEVNGRLGGGRIAEYHRMVTGVDLVEQVLLTAAGIPVAPSPHAEPACGIANVVVQSWCSGVLRHDQFLGHLAGDRSVFQADVTADAGTPVIGYMEGFPTVVAELSVQAVDAVAAKARALAMRDELTIPCG